MINDSKMRESPTKCERLGRSDRRGEYKCSYERALKFGPSPSVESLYRAAEISTTQF
jgi:hypothetical protein